MEIISLKPCSNEIVVNNGAAEGAVDLFCYAADEPSSRSLGALYVIGHRDNESTNMGYMVSLIAALARREYYAQPGTSPREAFSRTLRKANEVVEEFFKAGDVKLSIGIVAVAGGQIMVSKLDKFKILLARDEQVIDILSNVMLFSKEHTERRRFSSIIHGTVQAGDRILAYVPTRGVTTRERNLKSWFLKYPQDEFAQRVTAIGQEHATFATAMLHIDIAQTTEPAVAPSPQPPELTVPTIDASYDAPVPSLATHTTTPHTASPIAWSPRQQASPEPVTHPQQEPEMPHLIPSEFSLGTRRTTLSRWMSRIHFVRLDGRGKAIALSLIAIVVVSGVLITKSLLLVSPEEQQAKQVMLDVQRDVDLARKKNSDGLASEARGILSRAMASLEALGGTDDGSRNLRASILSSLDSIDNAQDVEPTLIASPGPEAEKISFAAWASPSSLFVGGAQWFAPLENGTIGTHTPLGAASSETLVGWKGGVMALNYSARTISRLVGSAVKTYTIPAQETILDAAEFADSLYILTDASILKVSDLDTDKPVMKRWLEGDTERPADAQRIFVDGSLYTMGRDGTLTTFYKGKQKSHVTVPVSPSGVWKFLPWSGGLSAIAVGDARRIYLINPKDGALVRTLKIDSQIPFTSISAGPDGSALLITSEGKLWQVK